MTPARVRFTGFLARNYRARSFTLAHSDGWWVCEIDKSGKFRNRIDQLARSVYYKDTPGMAQDAFDDTAHAAHTALGALKGWFKIWT